MVEDIDIQIVKRKQKFLYSYMHHSYNQKRNFL